MMIYHRNSEGTVLAKYEVRNGKDAEYTLVGLLLGRDINVRPGDTISFEEGSEVC